MMKVMWPGNKNKQFKKWGSHCCKFKFSYAQQYLCFDKLNILKNQKSGMVKPDQHAYQTYHDTTNKSVHCPSMKSTTAELDKHNFEDSTIRMPTPRNGYQTHYLYSNNKHLFECQDYQIGSKEECKHEKVGKKEDFQERGHNQKTKKTIKYKLKQASKVMYQPKQQTLKTEISVFGGFRSKQNENIEQTNSTRCQHASLKQHTNSQYSLNYFETEATNIKSAHILQQFEHYAYLCFSTPINLNFSFYGNIHNLRISSIFSYLTQIQQLIRSLRIYLRNTLETPNLNSQTDFEGTFQKCRKSKDMANIEEREELDYVEVGIRVIVLSKICELSKKKFIGKSDELLIISFHKLLDRQINTYSLRKIHRQNHQWN